MEKVWKASRILDWAKGVISLYEINQYINISSSAFLYSIQLVVLQINWNFYIFDKWLQIHENISFVCFKNKLKSYFQMF